MTALIAALMGDKPIPVAVVADQQELAKQADAEDNGEVEINTQVGSLRKRQRTLMEMVGHGEE
jgi:ribosomal protein L7Ae-like RNA K-turn-binding protein